MNDTNVLLLFYGLHIITFINKYTSLIDGSYVGVQQTLVLSIILSVRAKNMF